METALCALKLARERVAVGWCQNSYCIRSNGAPNRYCALGAMINDGYPTYAYLLEMTLALRGENTLLHRWNDRPERTQTEVLALYDETIARIARQLPGV